MSDTSIQIPYFSSLYSEGNSNFKTEVSASLLTRKRGINEGKEAESQGTLELLSACFQSEKEDIKA